MPQTFALLAYSDFLDTSYALQYCKANMEQWRDRVARPVWAVPDENLVVLGEADYTAANVLGQLRSWATRAKKDDWIIAQFSCHGTDEYPLYNESGVLVGRQQAICSDDFDFEKPGMLTATAIEAALAGTAANVALILDACTQGGFIQDSVDLSYEDKAVRRIGDTAGVRVRFLPNPAWAGKRAFRDLPVVTMVPEGERLAVLTACREGESAPDIVDGGFSDIATVLLAGEPAFPWSAGLLADAIGGRLDPAIGNHPQASGNIQNLPIAR